MTTVVAPAVRARLATSVAFGVQGLVFAALLTRVPALKSKLGFTDGELTLLLAIVPVIAGAGSMLAGALAARRGGAAVLRGAVVAACLCAAAVAWAPSRLTIYLALAGYGLAVGAVDAAMNMQGVAVQARYGRSIMNGFHAVWSLAGIVGALYTAAVAGVLSVEVSTSLVAAAGIAAILVAGRWLPVPPPEPVSTVGAAAVVAPAGGAVDGTADTSGAAVVPWRVLLPVGIVLGCVYVADSGVSNWSAVYLRDTLLSNEGVAALGYAAYQATSLLGRAFGDRLVSRYGTVPVVRAGLTVAAFGLLVVLAAPGPWAAIGGFAVAGIGASVLVPLSFSAAGRLDGGRGSAVARVNLFNYVGFLVGAPLVGAVGSVAGMRWGWLAPLALLVATHALARRLDPSPAVSRTSA